MTQHATRTVSRLSTAGIALTAFFALTAANGSCNGTVITPPAPPAPSCAPGYHLEQQCSGSDAVSTGSGCVGGDGDAYPCDPAFVPPAPDCQDICVADECPPGSELQEVCDGYGTSSVTTGPEESSSYVSAGVGGGPNNGGTGGAPPAPPPDGVPPDGVTVGTTTGGGGLPAPVPPPPGPECHLECVPTDLCQVGFHAEKVCDPEQLYACPDNADCPVPPPSCHIECVPDCGPPALDSAKGVR